MLLKVKICKKNLSLVLMKIDAYNHYILLTDFIIFKHVLMADFYNYC